MTTLADKIADIEAGLDGCPEWGTNAGHGHVWKRPDGIRARCGGPPLCRECAKDLARSRAADFNRDTMREIIAGYRAANARAEAAEADNARLAKERDAQYDENVNRIAAEGAALLRAEEAEARADRLAKENEERDARIADLLSQFDHAGCTCSFPSDDCCGYARAIALSKKESDHGA